MTIAVGASALERLAHGLRDRVGGVVDPEGRDVRRRSARFAHRRTVSETAARVSVPPASTPTAIMIHSSRSSARRAHNAASVMRRESRPAPRPARAGDVRHVRPGVRAASRSRESRTRSPLWRRDRCRTPRWSRCSTAGQGGAQPVHERRVVHAAAAGTIARAGGRVAPHARLRRCASTGRSASRPHRPRQRIERARDAPSTNAAPKRLAAGRFGRRRGEVRIGQPSRRAALRRPSRAARARRRGRSARRPVPAAPRSVSIGKFAGPQSNATTAAGVAEAGKTRRLAIPPRLSATRVACGSPKQQRVDVRHQRRAVTAGRRIRRCENRTITRAAGRLADAERVADLQRVMRVAVVRERQAVARRTSVHTAHRRRRGGAERLADVGMQRARTRARRAAPADRRPARAQRGVERRTARVSNRVAPARRRGASRTRAASMPSSDVPDIRPDGDQRANAATARVAERRAHVAQIVAPEVHGVGKSTTLRSRSRIGPDRTSR